MVTILICRISLPRLCRRATIAIAAIIIAYVKENGKQGGAEDRSQKAEDREQMAENRKQMAVAEVGGKKRGAKGREKKSVKKRVSGGAGELPPKK